jgi:hypothetical protein
VVFTLQDFVWYSSRLRSKWPSSKAVDRQAKPGQTISRIRSFCSLAALDDWSIQSKIVTVRLIDASDSKQNANDSHDSHTREIETMKTNKSSKSKSSTKTAKTNKSSEKHAAKLDKLGYDIKSNAGRVNAVLLASRKQPMFPAEIAEETGLAYRRARYQCRVLVKNKLAKKTKDGAYVLN